MQVIAHHLVKHSGKTVTRNAPLLDLSEPKSRGAPELGEVLTSDCIAPLDQLHELRGHKYVMPYWMALIHTGLKERDEAFRWLDTALEERSAELAYATGDPRFDYLRSDPRFQQLLRRAKLPS